MKIKGLLIVLVFALCICLLSGCPDPESGGTPTPTPATTETPATETPTPTPSTETPTPTPTSPPTSPPVLNPILVMALVQNFSIMDYSIRGITLTNDGVAIDDATVAINAAACSYYGDGVYLVMGASIDAGSDVTLTITGININISETLVMPEVPVVAAPIAAGGPYDSSMNLDAAWEAFSTEPDMIAINIDSEFTVDADGYSGEELGTVTAHTIPGNTIATAQTGVTVSVSSVMSSMLSGDSYETDSVFMVGNTSESEAFNTQ